MDSNRAPEDGFPASTQVEAVGRHRSAESSQSNQAMARCVLNLVPQPSMSTALVLYNNPSIRSSRSASVLPSKIHPGTTIESESTQSGTDVDPQSTAVTFCPFKRLPPELRCMIWKFALPPPATIPLKPFRSNDDEEIASTTDFFMGGGLFRPKGRQQHVRLCMVCRESRGVYLQELPHGISIAYVRQLKELPRLSFEKHHALGRLRPVYGTLQFGGPDSFVFDPINAALSVYPDILYSGNLSQIFIRRQWAWTFWQLAKHQAWFQAIRSLTFREFDFAAAQGTGPWHKTFLRFPHITEIRVINECEYGRTTLTPQQNRDLMVYWSKPMGKLRAVESQGKPVPNVVTVGRVYLYPGTDTYMEWQTGLDEARKKWEAELGTE